MINTVSIFYHMWYTNIEAAEYSLSLIRKTYPTNNIFMLIDIAPNTKVSEYETLVTNNLKKKFDITNVNYLRIGIEANGHYLNGNFEDQLRYCHIFIKKMLDVVYTETEYVVFATDDVLIQKEIPIRLDCDCGIYHTPRSQLWELPDLQTKFFDKLYKRAHRFIRVFVNHGDYFNIKKIRKNFTTKNKNLVHNLLYENVKKYSETFVLFPDFYLGVWSGLSFDTICIGNYLKTYFDDEGILTDATAMHGYKQLYSTFTRNDWRHHPPISEILHEYRKVERNDY